MGKVDCDESHNRPQQPHDKEKRDHTQNILTLGAKWVSEVATWFQFPGIFAYSRVFLPRRDLIASTKFHPSSPSNILLSSKSLNPTLSVYHFFRLISWILASNMFWKKRILKNETCKAA